jgi:peptidylprolyl isomerase
MNQLYKIGIIVAILLLMLLGLSKLGNSNPNEDVPERDTPTEEEQVEATTQDELQIEDISMSEQNNTQVVMKTNKGDITIELFTSDMPVTAGNFLKLAQEDFYDGIKFHRVIDGFMVQAGDPNSKDDTKQQLWGTGGPGYAIEDEFNEKYSNVRGTLAMANSGPNSGGSQFFINLVDNVNLDFNKPPLTSKHPVFGRVIDGMDVVDTIASTETGARDVPVEPIVIEDIDVNE